MGNRWRLFARSPQDLTQFDITLQNMYNNLKIIFFRREHEQEKKKNQISKNDRSKGIC